MGDPSRFGSWGGAWGCQESSGRVLGTGAADDEALGS